MKKIKLSVLVLIFSMAFLVTCNKDDDNKKTDRCPALATDVSSALTAFAQNPTQATCEAYIEAIHDYYDGCTLITAAERAQLDAALSGTNCTGF